MCNIYLILVVLTFYKNCIKPQVEISEPYFSFIVKLVFVASRHGGLLTVCLHCSVCEHARFINLFTTARTHYHAERPSTNC